MCLHVPDIVGAILDGGSKIYDREQNENCDRWQIMIVNTRITVKRCADHT